MGKVVQRIGRTFKNRKEMINYKDLKTDEEWETYRMNTAGQSVRIEFPYFNMYTYEVDSNLEKLVREYCKVFLNKDSKARFRTPKSSDLEKFIYWYQVNKHTEINCINVRGIEQRSFKFVLDHIIPISYAFKYDIDPSIIGSKENLQMLTNADNLIKSNRITDQVKDKLDEFNLNNLTEAYRFNYNVDISLLFGTNREHRKRINEGMYLKYYTKHNELLQTELL